MRRGSCRVAAAIASRTPKCPLAQSARMTSVSEVSVSETSDPALCMHDEVSPVAVEAKTRRVRASFLAYNTP